MKKLARLSVFIFIAIVLFVVTAFVVLHLILSSILL